jgi:hypothetical protein
MMMGDVVARLVLLAILLIYDPVPSSCTPIDPNYIVVAVAIIRSNDRYFGHGGQEGMGILTLPSFSYNLTVRSKVPPAARHPESRTNGKMA